MLNNLELFLYLFILFITGGGLSDLNFNDPELQEAATKIQAAYRGHRTRHPLKMAQEEEVVDIDLKDPGTYYKYGANGFLK